MCGVAVWNLGIVYWAGGDAVAGSQALEEAVRISRAAGNIMGAVWRPCVAWLDSVSCKVGLTKRRRSMNRHWRWLAMSRGGHYPLLAGR